METMLVCHTEAIGGEYMEKVTENHMGQNLTEPSAANS